MTILLFFAGHWYLSLFCQSFFHHRYAAHQMFTMARPWERFFHFLAFLTQGSSYLSPYAYGILHRLHHAHADTEQDPHSPIYDANLFAMMWRTKKIYSDIFYRKAEIDERYKKDLPEWFGFEKFADQWATRLAWAGFYIAFYLLFASSWWLFLLLPLQFVMGPLHGVIINWFAHKYGYINYQMKDTSRNMLPVDLLMMGESLHNNHHKFSGRANFGVKWYELDPTWPVIWLLHRLRIVRLKAALAK